MLDLTTIPGVSAAFGSEFAPDAWSAEYVANAIATYFAPGTVSGLMSIFVAKPAYWDQPQNFYGSGQPWGAAAFVWVARDTQTIYAGDGQPQRLISYMASLVCLFKSTLNDGEAVSTLQRRIADGVKERLRSDYTLGGQVLAAGTKVLGGSTDQPQTEGTPHDIWFQVDFDVKVNRPAGSA